MSDRLQIDGLSFEGCHGVFPQERQQRQRFEVDVELCFDQRPASAGDDLSLTVDVRAVVQEVRRVIEGPSCRLVETLVQRIADALLERDARIEQVRVRLRKPEAALDVCGARGYQVSITRSPADP